MIIDIEGDDRSYVPQYDIEKAYAEMTDSEKYADVLCSNMSDEEWEENIAAMRCLIFPFLKLVICNLFNFQYKN